MKNFWFFPYFSTQHEKDFSTLSKCSLAPFSTPRHRQKTKEAKKLYIKTFHLPKAACCFKLFRSLHLASSRSDSVRGKWNNRKVCSFVLCNKNLLPKYCCDGKAAERIRIQINSPVQTPETMKMYENPSPSIWCLAFVWRALPKFYFRRLGFFLSFFSGVWGWW